MKLLDLNNLVKNYTTDKQVGFACIGKSKFWFDYNRHVNDDMKSGVVTKVIMIRKNYADSKTLKHVCPDGSMVFADKANWHCFPAECSGRQEF